MSINSISLIYFSPTGTTRTIINGIAKGLKATTLADVDLTLNPPAGEGIHTDMAIIAAPVYGGRIPAVAAERLQQFQGRAIPAVVVVVYGNRAYEDALLELKHLAQTCGFSVIAAGAFIGEHSYATDDHPIARDRPDAADLESANAFGQRIAEKLTGGNGVADLSVPGNQPYKDQHPPLGQSPVTRTDLCTLCGTCATVCPTQVITVGDDTVTTDQSGCIACCACIKNCPTRARIYTATHIANISKWLYENHSERKAPEFFL